MSNSSTGNSDSQPTPMPAVPAQSEAPPSPYPQIQGAPGFQPPASYPPASYPPIAGYYQPPYPQSGYPYAPSAPMPPFPVPGYSQPRRGSLTPLWIILGVAASLILVACVACSVLFSLSLASLSSATTITSQTTSSTEDPVIAAEDFCAYEIDEDYANAYNQLSKSLQGTISQQQFQTDNQARDTSRGMLVGCSAALPADAVVSPGSPTSLTVTVWLATPSATESPPIGSSGDMTMVQEGSSWKVDAVDTTLQLT